MINEDPTPPLPPQLLPLSLPPKTSFWDFCHLIWSRKLQKEARRKLEELKLNTLVPEKKPTFSPSYKKISSIGPKIKMHLRMEFDSDGQVFFLRTMNFIKSKFLQAKHVWRYTMLNTYLHRPHMLHLKVAISTYLGTILMIVGFPARNFNKVCLSIRPSVCPYYVNLLKQFGPKLLVTPS